MTDAERKLAAVLSADVVGYSRLMAEDDVGTVQRITEYRELIAVRVREQRGRVVDSPGGSAGVRGADRGGAFSFRERAHSDVG